MCLIALAWRAHAAWPLVVAANRDEFFARPTASADWSDDGRRLSGCDLRGGGTWMGVTRDGRFAALTNYRDPAALRVEAPSRGALVDRFLDADDAEAALRALARDRGRYNGFNLITVRWAASPAGAGAAILSQPGPAGVVTVAPGLHGLSNAFLDTPWPKALAAVDGLRVALDRVDEHADAEDRQRGEPALIDALFGLLADRAVAADDALPDTGVPLEIERALSAAFIRRPDYGTRSSTVFLVDLAGRATFVERRFEPDAPVAERRFTFATPAP